MKQLDGKSKVLYVVFVAFLIISGALFNMEQMIPAVICFGVAIIAVSLLTVAHQKNTDI